MSFTPFGEYQLLERIGSGGMAEVFRACSEKQPHLVALKCIRPQFARDPAFLSMFVDEARIASHLAHKNIVKLLDYGEVDGRPFLIFDHIHGRDLRTLCRRHQMGGTAMPLAQACYVVLEACRGLEAAHDCTDSRGRPLDVVHRDVSPQNLLLSFQGELKVIDFGIARAACRTSVTERGWIKGKMHYMSPEQIRGLPSDRRTDLFALGAVLYELTTGKRLFDTDDSLELVQRIKSAQISRPSAVNPALPSEFDDVVLIALQARPDDRYQSAGQFHDALMAFVQRHGHYISRNRVADWMKTLYRAEYWVERARIAKLWTKSMDDDREPGDRRSVPATGKHTAPESVRTVDDLEPTVRQRVTLIGWAPARPDTVAAPDEIAELEAPDHDEFDFEFGGPTHDLPATAHPRLPMPVSASDLADFAVAVAPRAGSKRSLPLPPSPEESGEIRLGSLLQAVHHSPPRPPARSPIELADASEKRTSFSSDKTPVTRSGRDGSPKSGRSRWIGWTGWPMVTTVAIVLAALGGAIFL